MKNLIRLIEIFFAENARFFESYLRILALKIGNNLIWYGTLCMCLFFSLNGPFSKIFQNLYWFLIKLGAPERPSIAYVGDGAWGMSLNEMMTCVRENIPVIAVVFNNQQWGAEKKNQVNLSWWWSELHKINKIGVSYIFYRKYILVLVDPLNVIIIIIFFLNHKKI